MPFCVKLLLACSWMRRLLKKPSSGIVEKEGRRVAMVGKNMSLESITKFAISLTTKPSSSLCLYFLEYESSYLCPESPPTPCHLEFSSSFLHCLNEVEEYILEEERYKEKELSVMRDLVAYYGNPHKR